MKKGLIRIFELKNIISIKDFERKDIEYILDEASKLENVAKSREISEELKGKILGLMFFEPSTRTKLSFETSMKRLGGECISQLKQHDPYSLVDQVLYQKVKVSLIPQKCLKDIVML